MDEQTFGFQGVPIIPNLLNKPRCAHCGKRFNEDAVPQYRKCCGRRCGQAAQKARRPRPEPCGPALTPGVTEADVSFFCPGIPQPGGSKRAFAHKTTGRIVVTEDCRRSKDWRAVVALAAERAMGGMPPLAGPLAVSITFTLPRPKGHYGTGRNARVVRAGAPSHPTTKPDTTKLMRSSEDALKGICWIDDAQIVRQHAAKCYGEAPGAWIEVRRLATGESEAGA